MKPVPICLLTTAYPSEATDAAGVPRGKFIRDMARGLAKKGCSVHVVTNADPGDPAITREPGVTVHRFHYLPSRWETLTRGSGIPENIRRLRNKLQVPLYFAQMFFTSYRILWSNPGMVINAHWAFPSGFIGYLLKLATRRPLVITAYGAEIFPILQGKMKFLLPFLRLAVRKADVVAGISHATVSSLRELTGRQDIQVIPDGIDLDYYRPGMPDASVAKHYGIEGKQLIFFTGRMVTRKGHRYLLEAMRRVSEAFPNARLVLGGNGPLESELRKLRKEWHLEKSVSMPGALPETDLVALLRLARIYVLPSCIDERGDTEGSATAALEAMACGTVSVISEVGGNVGAVEHGKGAYYVAPADSVALANRIMELLQKSDDEMKRLGHEARGLVEDRFSWDTVVKKYLKAIHAHQTPSVAAKFSDSGSRQTSIG